MNWAGDEARGVSTGQVMKEGQWGIAEGFEARGWGGDTSITFIVYKGSMS